MRCLGKVSLKTGKLFDDVRATDPQSENDKNGGDEQDEGKRQPSLKS